MSQPKPEAPALKYEVLHIGPEPAYCGDGPEHLARIGRRQDDLQGTLNDMARCGYRFIESRGEFAIFERQKC